MDTLFEFVMEEGMTTRQAKRLLKLLEFPKDFRQQFLYLTKIALDSA